MDTKILLENGTNEFVSPNADVKPICIEVEMSSEVGFFQIEEVLIQKINSSPVRPYISLYAGVTGQEFKKYL